MNMKSERKGRVKRSNDRRPNVSMVKNAGREKTQLIRLYAQCGERGSTARGGGASQMRPLTRNRNYRAAQS